MSALNDSIGRNIGVVIIIIGILVVAGLVIGIISLFKKSGGTSSTLKQRVDNLCKPFNIGAKPSNKGSHKPCIDPKETDCVDEDQWTSKEMSAANKRGECAAYCSQSTQAGKYDQCYGACAAVARQLKNRCSNDT